jgi:hypothetical protein
MWNQKKKQTFSFNFDERPKGAEAIESFVSTSGGTAFENKSLFLRKKKQLMFSVHIED